MFYPDHLVIATLTSSTPHNIHFSIITDPYLPPPPPPPDFPNTSYSEESVSQPSIDAVSYAEEWETYVFLEQEREREQHHQRRQRRQQWGNLQTHPQRQPDCRNQQQGHDIQLEPEEGRPQKRPRYSWWDRETSGM
ncbi:MAG: hypothetical protein MMC33_009983 [Icmadophila ericetorum]|nr:hypothetical protein [Icmadophila ericetorum]